MKQRRFCRAKPLIGLLLLSLGVVSSASLPANAQQEAPPPLQVPIDCKIGAGPNNCHIAFYPDHDDTQGVKDYRCGARTYSPAAGLMHRGTDFAVLDASVLNQWKDGGPAVLAAADGIVYSTREGMRDDFSADPLASNACGNRVVIDHGDGWLTAYCHMRHSSITVRSGESVKAGDELGRIGLSGNTTFPHLHFSIIRPNAKGEDIPYDPFSGTPLGKASCSGEDTSFWSKSALAEMPYQAAQIVKLGFTDRRPLVKTIIRGQRHKKELVWDAYDPIFGFLFFYGARPGLKVQIAIMDEKKQRLAAGTRVLQKTERGSLSSLSLRDSNTFKDLMLRRGKAPLGQLSLFVRVLDEENRPIANGLARTALVTSIDQNSR